MNQLEPPVTRYQQGWQDAIDAVRSSLKEWPNMGCDTEIGKAVEDIVEAAEARALAAETVIDNALKHWETVAGPMLSLTPMKHILGAIDLTAAREIMQKAREYDLNEVDAALELCGNDDWIFDFDLDTLAKCISAIQRQREELRTERDGLLALVESWERYVADYQQLNNTERPKRLDDALSWRENDANLERKLSVLKHEKPTVALADLKARIRREALEEAAKLADDKAIPYAHAR